MHFICNQASRIEMSSQLLHLYSMAPTMKVLQVMPSSCSEDFLSGFSIYHGTYNSGIYTEYIEPLALVLLLSKNTSTKAICNCFKIGKEIAEIEGNNILNLLLRLTLVDQVCQ